jgi:hypothetical protein
MAEVTMIRTGATTATTAASATPAILAAPAGAAGPSAQAASSAATNKLRGAFPTVCYFFSFASCVCSYFLLHSEKIVKNPYRPTGCINKYRKKESL